MTEFEGFDDLCASLRGIQESMMPTMARAMKRSVILVESTSKKNCTPGQSPYSRAPYSDDNDPRREPPHMRDVMYHRVLRGKDEVSGVIGNPKHYSLYVHEGTLRMPARPFIMDAIKQHEQDIVDIFNEEIEIELMRHAEGDIYGTTPSEYPTEMEDE
jgi:HK97 gp10 family phage protein